MSEDRRLIIIDDEALLLMLLKEQLESFGLTVFTFEDVPDIGKVIKEISPHAILLDIVMPRQSGVEILRNIKAANRDIPVIIMTGHADEKRRIEVLRNGAYTLLTKPFLNFEELYHTISNAMNHYLAVLSAKALSKEVEERYKREKINILELEFLKSLQQMIGEAEEDTSLSKTVFSLLKEFLSFNYFSTLLFKEGEIHTEVYTVAEGREGDYEQINSILLARIPPAQREGGRKVTIHGKQGEIYSLEERNIESLVVELSTADSTYGYAGLFRKTPFEEEERFIFGRFCSHIVIALEKIHLFNEIKILSIRDGLTGAFNHAYIMKEMESEMQRARRYNASFSLIMLDIDDFKKVNDTFGHLAGDHVLRTISQLMIRTFRTIDIVGRYGGEEFMVILPGIDAERACIAGERLRKAIEEEDFSFEEKPIRITASIGIATYREDAGTQGLIKRADNNLLKAKAGGKNRIYYE